MTFASAEGAHVLAHNRQRGEWRPLRRDHPVTVRIDGELLAEIRAEAKASGWSVSAVARRAIRSGLQHLANERLIHDLEKSAFGA